MKKVLLIAPVFFDYYKEIKNKLETKNYKVDFIRDSASPSNFYKAISRINKKMVQLPMKKYFNKEVLKKTKSIRYDYVILIAGMTYSFTNNMIKQIRETQQNAKFIMYQWDGEKNISYVNSIHKYFDKICTFDRIDAEKNKKYNFLPLFYIDKYAAVSSGKEYKYDVSYIGTAHPKKLSWINIMSKELKKYFPRQFIYQYMPSKLKYFYHKLLSREYKNAKLSDFKFNKLSADEIKKIYEDSKCILDSPQSGQIGLTIRTIECLGAKRKLITTNKDIKNYDFYCDENILIFDEKYKDNKKFFDNKYKELPDEIYKKYSIEKWIDNLLDI